MPTKVSLVNAMVFPVVIYRCESWTIKKVEPWRIDAFELRCWRRLLRVPWTARRSNQSILREISPGCSLEGLILKLKLQYFGYLMRRANSLERPAGKDWGQEEKGTTENDMVGWHHQLNGHGFAWTLGVGDGQGGLACCGSRGLKESDRTEWLNWTELNIERLMGVLSKILTFLIPLIIFKINLMISEISLKAWGVYSLKINQLTKPILYAK